MFQLSQCLNICVTKKNRIWEIPHLWHVCEYFAAGLIFQWTFHDGSASRMDSRVRQMARIQVWHHAAEHEKTRSHKNPQHNTLQNDTDADETHYKCYIRKSCMKLLLWVVFYGTEILYFCLSLLGPFTAIVSIFSLVCITCHSDQFTQRYCVIPHN